MATPAPVAPEDPFGTLPYARRAPRWRTGAGLVDAAVVLSGIAATLLFAALVVTEPRLGPKAVVLLIGAVGLFGMLALALTRFEEYLVVLFVVRTSLDHFRPQQASGVLAPATLVGGLTLAVGAVWLWSRHRQGRLVETSRVSLALIGFSALTFVNPLFAVGRIESLLSAVRLLSFTVLFIVLEQVFRTDPTKRRRFLIAICWSLVVPTAVAGLDLVAGTGTDQFLEVGRVRGTFFHPNPFGTYLVMVVVVGFVLATTATRAARPLFHLTSLVAGGVLIFTYARGAWVAAVLGAVVLGVRVDRRILRGLVVGGVLIVLFVPSVVTRLADLDNEAQVGRGDPNSLSWRVGYWEDILPFGLSSPVGGIGLDSTPLVTEDGLEPHNVFIQSFVELGLPGFVMLLILLLAIVNEVHRSDYWARDAWERALAAGAAAIGVGFFVQLFSENLLTQPVSLWYLGVVLAAALANGWDGGVSPTTIRGVLSIRQRLSLFLDERRRPTSEHLEGVDLGARIADILERNARRSPPVADQAVTAEQLHQDGTGAPPPP